MPTRTLTAYTTTSAVKAQMGIADNSLDSVISSLILAATAYIEGKTRRWFAGATQTRYFDYQSARKLTLDADLCSLTSITCNDGATVNTANVLYYPTSGPPYTRLEIKATATSGFSFTGTDKQAIAVAGTWGYSSTPPDDIAQACIVLVASALNEAASAGLGSVSVEFARSSFDRNEHPVVTAALGRKAIRIG